VIPPGAEAEADRIGLSFEIVGGASDTLLGGILWENGALAKAARGRYLINLTNRFPLALKRGAVLIHDAHVFDLPSTYKPVFGSFYRSLYRLAVTRGLDLVTVSEFSRARLSQALGIDSDRWTIIKSGIDHILEPEPDFSVLQRFGLVPEGYLLTVGALSGHKNLGALKLLARALAEQGRELVAVGDMSPAVYAGADLGEGLKHVGQVDDGALRALMENARCFVFPSQYEGFGLPPLEAMALGCPVATSDIAPLREACGKACIFFDPDDPEDIAERVLALSNDEAQRLHLGNAGREVTRNLTWHRSAQKWLDLLSVASKSSRVLRSNSHST
jgi:glycosyltransferase involved in cell wall biosynthesis